MWYTLPSIKVSDELTNLAGGLVVVRAGEGLAGEAEGYDQLHIVVEVGAANAR